jgi:hypothetical protein
MAYARSNSKSKHGTSSMARRNTDSDDYSPPPSNNRNISKVYHSTIEIEIKQIMIVFIE